MESLNKLEQKQGWLDAISTRQFKQFISEHIDDRNVGKYTIVRYCYEGTMVTAKFELLDANGDCVYQFLPFYAGVKEEGIKYSQLLEDWIVFIAECNSKKEIAGKIYIDAVLENLKENFDENDEDIALLIDAIELSKVF